ncbi:hypothetical protein [Halochromatium salexigens]|uniref:UDP:flavonoid glycosyltransferase YjiC (YdhE family) n=1 Tax=Halochromatium salexigens TaxID=49447 RepID=A0AAJ0UE85_HALSE|nr:hypothetical protein [Halochromatium salexigens]MBK5929693.1 hypothetical protein [Halochromatium salexigens]
MPHLFVAVTAHGYGHLAQVAPVVTELKRRLPNLEISLQGNIAPAFAKARLPAGYHHISSPADVQLPMDGPLTTRWAEGLADYVAFDLDYPAHQARQRRLFEQTGPDLVLADIPWLPLDVARSMGIPCAGLCSLSWYDILVESPVGDQLPTTLAQRMQRAYSGADLFLRPAPSMPMSWLPNGRDIGPIAQPRRRDPAGLHQRFGRPASEQLVLMQFGGTGRLQLGGTPRLMDGVHLLSPDVGAELGRDDLTRIDADGNSVLEVLASCDALITKPGYGTFAEAACNGIPVLSVERRDWPESRWLVDWLAQQLPLREISASDFAAGRIREPLAELLVEGIAEPVAPTGVGEAVDLLIDLLN